MMCVMHMRVHAGVCECIYVCLCVFVCGLKVQETFYSFYTEITIFDTFSLFYLVIL